jgi:hypothetical protein
LMNLIETLQELMNLNRDLLIGLRWPSAHEREFGV